MKPDYYIHQHTREVVETTRDGNDYTHERVEKTEGEHVMTYPVFKTLKEKDVIGLIGPLAQEKKRAKKTPKLRKKDRKAATKKED